MEAEKLEARELWIKNKWKSRTFLLVLLWMAFVPLGIVAQLVVPEEVRIPITEIVWSAGVTTSLFMAGEKGKNVFMAKNKEL